VVAIGPVSAAHGAMERPPPLNPQSAAMRTQALWIQRRRLHERIARCSQHSAWRLRQSQLTMNQAADLYREVVDGLARWTGTDVPSHQSKPSGW
jgi:hypothetical protein